MDRSDFHQEISFSGAVHQTIDQFDLTVNNPYIAHTRRAKDFNDSLSIISTLAVIYCVYSLFQPLKFKFLDPYNRRFRQLTFCLKDKAIVKTILRYGHTIKTTFLMNQKRPVLLIAYIKVWR